MLLAVWHFDCLCISLVRQIGFPVHFISVALCCPLVLIADITQMWQDACHIWKYYIKKCYKMLVIFTLDDTNYVIFTKMTQYYYSHDWIDFLEDIYLHTNLLNSGSKFYFYLHWMALLIVVWHMCITKETILFPVDVK